MTWLSLRTQRTEMLIAAGLVALLAAALLPSGLHMLSVYHHEGLAACAAHPDSGSCGAAVHAFTNRFESLGNVLGWLTLVPGLIGVLLAAPVVIELESGTYRLAWTQSVPRGRWIAAKLLTAVAAGVVAAGLLILFLTWWRGPLVHLQGRIDPVAFDSQGFVAIAYTLFALGLGLALGVVWRRAVPALVVAFGLYAAARVAMDVWGRQHLVAPLGATWGVSSPGPDLSHAWVLTEFPSDRLGHHVPVKFVPLGACADKLACLAKLGPRFTHAVYEPAGRFWLFQGIETAIFGGVALCLLGFAARWIHERAS